MRKFIYNIISIVLYFNLNIQIVQGQPTSHVPLIDIDSNSLIIKLLDTIISRDSDCGEIGSDFIAIICDKQDRGEDVTYFIRVLNGICIIDATDTLLIGTTFYKAKQILWYNSLPVKLSCRKTLDYVPLQTFLDCPIKDFIPETYCLYHLGVLSICKRQWCNKMEETSYENPIVIGYN